MKNKTLNLVIRVNEVNEKLIQTIGDMNPRHFDKVNITIDTTSDCIELNEELVEEYDNLMDIEKMISEAKDIIKAKLSLMFRKYGFVSALEEFEMECICNLVEISDKHFENIDEARNAIQDVLDKFEEGFVKIEDTLMTNKEEEKKVSHMHDEIACSVMNSASTLLNNKLDEHQQNTGVLKLTETEEQKRTRKHNERLNRRRPKRLANIGKTPKEIKSENK